MNNKGKIIAAIATFLVLGIILFLLFSKKDQPAPIENTPTKNIDPPLFPIIPGEKPNLSDDAFNIRTGDGNIPIKNIYKLPDTNSLSDDGINFKNSSYYYMAYYPKQQGFIIAVVNPDIEKSRTLAESDFLDILSITKDQACKLNVSLTVTPDAKSIAGGGNYRLSFCPNGKPFPKK